MVSFVKNNLNIIVAGFGCCKQEILATTSPIYDISRFGISFVSIPEDADILVVQGFYNEMGEKRLLEIYSRMRDPKWVIGVGKCIVDASMLDRSYKFVKRFNGLINIDYYLPGCPPRPEAFIYCMLKLMEIH
jgi:NADH:ubiquinone oxidoreductase subunit B-like Fe-S oxidoreductase